MRLSILVAALSIWGCETPTLSIRGGDDIGGDTDSNGGDDGTSGDNDVAGGDNASALGDAAGPGGDNATLGGDNAVPPGGDNPVIPAGDNPVSPGGDAVVRLPVIVPAYPGYADWNDYLVDDGTSQLDATGTACTGTEPSGYGGCLHGGTLRKATIDGLSDCSGVTAVDALGVFSWSCDDSGSAVVVYSTGFQRGKGLQHLVDVSGFLSNQITVAVNGTEVAGTASAVWGWQNPVEPLPGAAAATTILDQAGTIYVHTGVTTAGINIDADRIAVVGLSGAAIDLGGAAPNCVDATGEATPADAVCTLAAGAQDFLWIETAVTSGVTGIYLIDVRSSRIHLSEIHDVSDDGFELGSGTRNNLLTEIEASGAGDDGVQIRGLLNRAQFVRSWSNNDNGLLSTGDGNVLLDVISANNGGEGFKLLANRENVASRIISSNNATAGVRLQDAVDHVLTDITVFSSQGLAFVINGSASRNTVQHATVLNSAANHIVLHNQAANNTLVSILSLNSDNLAFNVGAGSGTGTLDNLVVDLAAGGGSDDAVSLSNSADRTTFSGRLLTSNTTPCRVTGTGLAPGLINLNCTDSGADGSNIYTGQSSDAVLRIGLNFDASIVGKVDVDATNPDHTGGTSAVANITEWTRFDNRYRAWGVDGAAFPANDHAQQCDTEICRIWDASLRATDTTVRNINGVFSPGGVCPTDGNDVTSDQQGSANSFLTYAQELLGDGSGDDDGLCESSERCVFAPNLGSYQGHGALVGPCVFSSGTVSGVTLFGRIQNGR